MNERLNAICPYFAMFPLDYPRGIIETTDVTSVLDPFCGRGTTNLAARMNGVYSAGIDSSEVAYSIASSKMVSTTPEDIIEECRGILDGPVPEDVPQGEFWDLMYRRGVLEDMCKIRRSLLEERDSPERKALCGIVLGALHGPLRKSGGSSYLSNQFPRTYASKPNYSVEFWKRKGLLTPPDVSVLDVVAERAYRFYTDTASDPCGMILRGDSTDSSTFDRLDEATGGRRFDTVITSPPYMDMHTYIPDQWIRHWFVGGPATVDYTTRGQIRNVRGSFTAQLRRVWINCADVCDGGARLHMRFGKIGSNLHDPRGVALESLEDTDWKVMDVTDAGTPGKGRRQCDTFLSDNRNGYREIDVSAVLC